MRVWLLWVYCVLSFLPCLAEAKSSSLQTPVDLRFLGHGKDFGLPVDQVFANDTLDARLFVVQTKRKTHKNDSPVWSPIYRGLRIDIRQKNSVTSIYVEGVYRPRDLHEIRRFFSKQNVARSSRSFFDSFLVDQALAQDATDSFDDESESGLKGRNLGSPAVQRDRARRQEAKHNASFFQCLGSGALSGLQGFADGPRAVGRWLKDLVISPKQAWKQVSDSFSQTVGFVLNMRQHLVESFSFLKNLPKSFRAELLCAAGGELIAKMGLRLLTRFSVAGALAQIIPWLRQLTERLSSAKDQLERLAQSSIVEILKSWEIKFYDLKFAKEILSVRLLFEKCSKSSFSNKSLRHS